MYFIQAQTQNVVEERQERNPYDFDAYLANLETAEAGSQDTQTFESQLSLYLASPRADRRINPLKYWAETQYTKLSRVAVIALAVPVTQVSVERLFSGVTFILNSLRNRLSPNTLHKILVLRENFDMISS
jgi:hypothetical protein